MDDRKKEFPSIAAAVALTAEKDPERFCLADNREHVSFGEFWSRTAGFAGFLEEQGVQPGSRVVIRNSQNIYFIGAVLAVQLLGAVSVPLEKNVADARIRELCEETEAIICLSSRRPDAEVCWLDILESGRHPADEREQKEMRRRALEMNPDSLAEILYTTGTTGKSKGILLTHRAVTAVAENVIDGVEMKRNNVEMIPVPLSHSHGLRRLYANLLNGSAAVLLDGVVFMGPFFRAMDQWGVTAIDLVPAALTALLSLSGDRLGEYRDQLDYVQLGSAPVPEADARKLCNLLPRTRCYNFYGTTESGCSCILDFNDGVYRPNCIGRPAVHAEFAFFGPEGKPAEATPEAPGLLACRGAMNMTGYFHSPQMNEEVFSGDYIVTQDLAYRGEDGLIYLLGRQGDVISCGGSKIAPQEIEDAVRSIPGVWDCACMPEPDAVLGQVPKLYYAAEASVSERDIYEALREKLETYKVPKHFMRVPQIPRTFNGKIRRGDLDKLFAETEDAAREDSVPGKER